MFSTSVEMIPVELAFLDLAKGVLYECGDDPMAFNTKNAHCQVFSTSVEMILIRDRFQKVSESVLYECGDDPENNVGLKQAARCSLRVWR